MTTDRTAAPAPRPSSALAERPAPGRPSTAPSDTFAVLLGAAAPPPDTHAPARRPEQPERHDHTERADRRRDDHASHAVDRRPAAPDSSADPPQAPDAPATPVAAAAGPIDAPAAPLAAPANTALIAAQLSSPLAAAPAAQPAPAAAAAQPAPVKVLSGLVAASTVPAAPVAGQPLAGAPLPPQAADAAAPADPATLSAAAGLPLAGPAAAKPLAQPIPAFAKPAGDAKPVAGSPAPAKPADPAAPAAAPAPAAPTVTASAPVAAAQVADATAKPSDSPAQAQAPALTAPPLAGAAFAAPASAPAGTPTAAPQRLVPMTRVVENTAALLRIAADRGVTHARLNLKPAELGGIEVRLRATPDGVAAQLVADSPEAARMLSQAGDDLRRQLAGQNVNLLSLDVSTSGEQQQSAAQFAADAGADHGYRGGAASRHSHGAHDAGDLAGPAAAESTLLLPTGVLVDVLA